MKQAIIEKIAVFLLKRGYTVKNLKRGCFDILGRKESAILLIKVLEDANSVSREYADEMNVVASYINATPLIVAEKAGSKLEKNIVYTRFGICTINFSTLENCVHNRFPFIKRTQAGLTASIIGNKIKSRREELGLSLNAMSKKLGVSGRMVSKYENGFSEITINKALKIYELCGDEVFYEINIFNKHTELTSNPKSDLSKKYVEMGFKATDTRKSPFDIIAKKNNEIIITEVGDKFNPDSLAVSKLIDADNLVIFDKKKPKDIAAMTKKEFLEFVEADELIKFLKGF